MPRHERPRTVRPRIQLLELEDRVNPVAFEYALTVGTGGTNNDTRAVTTDAAGNVYTTGRFFGTFDFDPSGAVQNLTSSGNSDAYVAKYTAAGSLVWAGAIDAVEASAIAVDGQGNVFVAGTIFGTVDLNPGPGTNLLTSHGVWDGFVLKLNAAGAYQWAAAQGGTGDDFGVGLAVDAAGNAVTTGYFRGTADFDPSAANFNLTSAGGDDAYIARYTPSGSLAWAKRWGGTGHDRAHGVALDAQGNAVTTGYFDNTVDLDPGPGTVSRTAAYTDGFVSKFDTLGNLVWAKALGQTGDTISVIGTAVAVDGTGNVVLTGSFYGTPDFDPDAQSATLDSDVYENPFVLKLTGGGAYVWAKKGASAGHSGGTAIAVDVAGSVYTTGYFEGTDIDFDPSAAVFPLSSPGYADSYVSKLDAKGDFVWAGRIGGPGIFDDALGIAVDRRGAVYATGNFSGTADLNPTAGTHSVTAVGASDGYLVKLVQSAVSGVVWEDTLADGYRAPGEPLVAGSTVELLSDGGVSYGVQITGPTGEYLFIDMPAGDYQVQFRPPHRLNFTGQNQADDARDSDANSAGITGAFSVPANQSVAQDAGLTGTPAAFGFAVPLGSPGVDDGRGVTADAAGNVYVAGSFNGTVDFDSSLANFYLTSTGGSDAYVAKYTAAGALVWARAVGGSGASTAHGVTVDSRGNVFTTGSFSGLADFDPDLTATAERTSEGGLDAYIQQLDADGRYVLYNPYAGPADQVGRAITVDAAGYTYITGSFSGLTEFLSGPPLTTAANKDGAFVMKIAPNFGGVVWVKPLSGPGNVVGAGIAVDGQGNVVTTGYFNGAADFDPGVGSAQFTTGGGPSDAYVSKLAANGNYLWAKRFGSHLPDEGAGVAVDAAGNVYTTGYFSGQVDFNPSDSAVNNVTSAGDRDAFVSKLTAGGEYVWAKAIGGATADQGAAVAVDAQGNVYTTGTYSGSVDLDPGAGVAREVGAGITDAYASKLTGAGDFVWGRAFLRENGGDGVTGAGIAVTAQQDVYVTGSFHWDIDFDPSSAHFYVNTAGQSDAFLVKMTDATVTGVAWHDANGNGVRDGGEPPMAGVVVELFDLGRPRGAQVTGADGAYSFVAPPYSGNYYVQFRPPVGFGFSPAGGGSAAAQATGLTPGFPLASHQTAVKDAGLVGAAPAYGFAAAMGGVDGVIETNAVATDAAGFVYAAGSFSNTVDFDPSNGVYALTKGGEAAFVAKYTPAGALVWVKAFGDVFTTAYGLAVDAGGNVVVVGKFYNTVDFDPDPQAESTLNSGSGRDGFVLKLNAAGHLAWVGQYASPDGEVQMNGVAVDAAGNVYTAGIYLGTLDADPTPAGVAEFYGSYGYASSFVSKLTPAGQSVWARGGYSDARFYAVAVDAAGGVYAGGTFAANVDFDPSGAGGLLTSAGDLDGVVLKLNSGGQFAWAGQIGGTQADSVNALTINAAGNVVAVGSFRGTSDFDPLPAATNDLTAAGAYDAFATAWTPLGQFAWAAQIGGPGTDNAFGAAADTLGNVFVAGQFAGSMTLPLAAGPRTLTAAETDPYVAKIDAAGRFVTVEQFAGPSDGLARAVATGPAGKVYTAGDFTGPQDFDPSPAGVFQLTAAGVYETDDSYVNVFTVTDVSGVVWTDLNGDGLRNLGDYDNNNVPDLEPGFAGARVELWGNVNGTDVVLETVTTLADGVYHFANPAAGPGRFVRVGPPVGTAGNNPSYAELTKPGGDGDVDANGKTAVFDLTADPIQSFNAGLKPVPAAAPGFALAGSGASAAKGVAKDAAGNTYVVGSFTGSPLDVDPRVSAMIVAGHGGGYAVKYSAAGVPEWAVRLSGSSGGAPEDVALDAAGNVYVVGTFAGNFSQGGPTMLSAGVTDAFVVKLSAAGVVQWAQKLGGTNADAGVAVAVDPVNGTVHVAGSFAAAATVGAVATVIGSSSFTNDAGTDGFLVRLDSLTGAPVTGSARQLAGTGEVTINALAVNSTNVFVGGSFTGAVDLNPFGVQGFTSVGGSSDGFLVKLTSSAFVWARQIGAGGADAVGGLALTPAGDVLFAGGFQNTVNFNVGGFNNLISAAGGNEVSAFAAKYSGAGSFVWAKGFGGAAAAVGVATDARGYVYVAGPFTGGGDFDPGSGNVNLTAAGATDVFVVKLSAAGNYVYADRIGGDEADAPAAIAVAGLGSVTVVGSFTGVADVAFGRTAFLLDAGAGAAGFVSHLAEFSIQGKVWIDEDADGARDANEPAVTDALVELFDSVDGVFGNGDDVVIGQVPSTGGAYQFLDPADSAGFYVRVTPLYVRSSSDSLPVTFATAPGQGDDDTKDSDITEAGYTPVVSRIQGIANLGAGFQEAPLTAGGWGVGGAAADAGRAVATDAAGNVYVVGTFEGTVDFDPRLAAAVQTSRGGADGYVAMYDSAGRRQWARRVGGAGADKAVAVAVGADGHVYVTGTFEGAADFGDGSIELTAKPASATVPGRDVFVLKLTAAGAYVWAAALGGAKAETVTGLAVDATGNVVTTGTFEGTADFNPSPTAAANLASTAKVSPQSGPSVDVFLSKLDKDGKYVWARKVGSSAPEYSAGVAVDAAGNVYFNGKSFDGADADPGPRTDFVGGSFVIKYTPAGQYVWADEVYDEGETVYELPALAVTADAVYLAGSHLWKLTPAGETVGDITPLGLVYQAIAVDAAGTVHLAGTITGPFNANPYGSAPALSPAGSAAAIVTRFGSVGEFIAAYILDGAFAADAAAGVAVGPGGTSVVAGTFQLTTDFAVGPAAQLVNSEGGADAFVWKIPAGGVSGRVWHDANGDGLRSPAEPTVGGALVSLYAGADTLVQTQIAASDGSYHFAAPSTGGPYFVAIQPPALPDISYTVRQSGGNSFLDSDVDAQGRSATFDFDAAVPKVIDAGISGDYPLFGLAWAGSGAAGESFALASVTDAAGYVYVAGQFQGSVDFDPNPEAEAVGVATAGNDAFVAKYTPAGILMWLTTFRGSGDDGAQAVAVAGDGSVFVTGRFTDTFYLHPRGEISVTAAGYDAFVAKLNPDGSGEWLKALGGAGDDFGNGIAVAADRVVVAGSFQGTADFDPNAGVANLVSAGAQDAFVAAWSPDGDRVWERRVGGAGDDDVARGVAADTAGGIYVAGSFSGTADFDPGTVVRDQISAGQRDAFVWKLDAAGAAVWATQAGGPNDDDAAAVALARDPAGGLFAVGTFAEAADFAPGPARLDVPGYGGADAFVWRLDAAGGTAWAQALGGEGTDRADGVAADATGVYVAGAFQQTADFDPGPGQIHLVSDGGTDAFIAKLDPAGLRKWAHPLGGPGDDAFRGAAVDAAGRVTAAGTVYGPGSYDPGDGDLVIPAGPANNFVVARVDQTPAGPAFPLDPLEPNGAPAAAVDLGVMNAQHVVAGLSLSSKSDADWFRFDLLSAGAAGHRVRLAVTPDFGDVTMTLYAADATTVVASATRLVANPALFVDISLDGAPPGAYFLRVQGIANPAYSLSFAVPAGFAPDAAEPNGDEFSATDLDIPEPRNVVTRLSVNAPGDADWFRFDTVAEGTLAAEVRIDFRHAQGDIDLDLFDADGNPLRSSAGAGDAEAVSLAGLPAGRYFARVTGHGDAINPAYTLTVRRPRPLEADAKESNDSAAAATLLGEVRGERSVGGLSVHDAADADWFVFDTAAVGGAGHEVAIDFAHAEGDLDLRLYAAPYVPDDEPLAASTGNGDAERVSLSGLLPGTYYIKVSGYDGATQPEYRLRVNAPVGLAAADRLEDNGGNQTRQTASVVQSPGRTKLEGVQTLVDLTLHTAADQDWYRFTTAGKGTAQHQIVLTHPAANGTIGLELYSATGAKLATAVGANGSLVVSLKGRAAGSYYVRAFVPPAGGAGGPYTLTFDAPGATAVPDDWTVMVYMTADSLTDRAFNDVNEMEAAVAGLPGSVNLAVLWDQSANLKTFPTGNGTQPAWGKTGRALIAPDTNPAAVATNFELLPEKDTGNPGTLKDFVAWAKTAAPAKHYALVFWDHGGGLRGFNFDTQDGQAAGFLTAGEVAGALAGQQPLDVIAFDACFMGVAETAYTLRDAAAVVVGSQDAVPGDGFEYDQAFSVLATNPAGVTAEALATGLVQAFAGRYGATGSGDTLAAVRTAGMTPLAAALHTLSTAVAGAADAARDRVLAAAASTLLPNAAADEQRDLGGFLAALASDGALPSAIQTAAQTALAVLDAAVVSRTADLRGHSGLSVYLPVVEDVYLTVDPAAVSNYDAMHPGFVAATAWPTMLNKLKDAADDRPDPQDSDDLTAANDVKSAATDLRGLGATGIVKAGLSLHANGDDEDWYKFQVGADAAGKALEVDVVNRSPGTALVADLRDESNTTLATAVNGRLRVDSLPAAGTYYLYFRSAAAVNSYGFTVNPPAAAVDRSGDNSSPEKTYALGPQANGVYAGFAVAADSQDWLRFDTTAQTTAELRRANLTVSGGAVTAQLRTAAGAVVSSATGSGALVLPYTVSGAAESYTVVIVNPNAGPVTYSLRLESVTAADGGHPFDPFITAGALNAAKWAVANANNIQVEDGRAVVKIATARALWTGFTAADVGVQATFRVPVTGRPTASVFARATEPGGRLTAYEARLEFYNGKLTAKLYRHVNGLASLLAFAAAPNVSAGVLRFDAVGQFLRVSVNGNQCLEFTDPFVLAAGRTGFGGAKGASLDDFQANVVAAPVPISYAAVAGGLGPAWHAEAGQFTVQDGRFVSGGVPAVALYTPARLADVAVSAGYSLQGPNQSVGVRARDDGAPLRSYYEAQLTRNASGAISAKLLRYAKGAAKNLITVGAPLPAIPATGTLRLEVLGNEVRMFVGGTLVFTARDASVLLPGKAGVTASAGMSLGAVTVTPLVPRVFNDFSVGLAPTLATVAGGQMIDAGRLRGTGEGRAVTTGPALLNATVSAVVDLSGGVGQKTVGLIARHTGATYYEGRLTVAGAKLTAVIYKVENGVEKALKTLPIAKATAGVLTFSVEGSNLKLSLFGESLTVTDTALTAAGATGVHLGLNDTADDFTVR